MKERTEVRGSRVCRELSKERMEGRGEHVCGEVYNSGVESEVEVGGRELVRGWCGCKVYRVRKSEEGARSGGRGEFGRGEVRLRYL
jgi:hypothetical protein